MNNRLIIIGAGGHGKVCAEIAKLNGYEDIAFLDDRNNTDLPVIGSASDYLKYIKGNDFFIAIGNNEIRRLFFENIIQTHGNIVSLIHPKSVISKYAFVGVGTVVMAGAVINAGANICQGCIVNTCASVDHDCRIGDFVHVSVGSHLSGTVTVGDETWIGAGATVSNNLSICSGCMIGAGAVVINDVDESGTYVGVPARKIK